MGRFSEARAAFRAAVVEDGSSIIICHQFCQTISHGKMECSMYANVLFQLITSRKKVASYSFLATRPYDSMASHILEF